MNTLKKTKWEDHKCVPGSQKTGTTRLAFSNGAGPVAVGFIPSSRVKKKKKLKVIFAQNVKEE